MKKVIRCYGSLREKYGGWRSRRDLNSQEKPAWRTGAIPLGDYSIKGWRDFDEAVCEDTVLALSEV